MFKQSFIVILLLLIAIIAISGCTSKTATNGTFGEKVVSVNLISISNNTTSNNTIDDNGNNFFYIDGYLINNNANDVFHIKLNATAYNANGSIVATNDSVYLYSTTIPAKGVSEFYVDFPDPNNEIVRYTVKIIDAKGTL